MATNVIGTATNVIGTATDIFVGMPDDIKYMMFRDYFDPKSTLRVLAAYPWAICFYDTKKLGCNSFGYFSNVDGKITNYIDSTKGRRLDVYNIHFDSTMFFYVSQINSIKVLWINLFDKDPVGIECLSAMQHLEFLSLSINPESKYKPIDMSFLSSLTNLKYLVLTLKHYSYKLDFSNLCKLKYFSYHVKCHDSNVKPLLTLSNKKIKVICINFIDHIISIDEIKHISESPLEKLEINMKITNAMIKLFSFAITLKYLSIFEYEHDNVKQNDFGVFSSLVNLVGLKMSILNKTVSSINEMIKSMNQLETFDVRVISLSLDNSVPLIVNNPKLSHLHVNIPTHSKIVGLQNTVVRQLYSVNDIDKSFLDYELLYLQDVTLDFNNTFNCDLMETKNVPNLISLVINEFSEHRYGIDFIKNLPEKTTSLYLGCRPSPTKKFIHMLKNIDKKIRNDAIKIGRRRELTFNLSNLPPEYL